MIDITIWVIVLVPLMVIGIWIWRNYNKWHQRLFPDHFIDYRILNKDNSINDGFHRKGKPLIIEKCNYDYMYPSFKTYKGSKSYLFKEGMNLPISYDNSSKINPDNIDAELKENLEKKSLIKLFEEENSFKNFMQSWGNVIIIAGIIFLIVIVIQSGGVK